jgi:hypothetical protein
MYMDSAVALSGCHAQGIERNSCELDVLVIGKESRPPTSAKLGGVYMDLFFADERELLKQTDPELLAAMANLRPIRDTTLVISTSSAAAAAVYDDACRRSERGRLASAVKSLGRVDEALSKETLREADFWLLAAAYDYAYAWLYSKEVIPAPSHLLGQLKEQSKGSSQRFGAFSRGAALEKASRGSCRMRLEGVGVLHDVIRSRQAVGGAHSAWAPARLEIVKSKAHELGLRIEHAESYSYLGQEVVRTVLGIATLVGEGGTRVRRYSGIGHLFAGSEHLLGESLLVDLGFARDRQELHAAARGVKEQVSALARKA